MNMFELSEGKALLFHQAIVELAHQHPNLIKRAITELEQFRKRLPDQMSIWDRWAALLEMPLDKMAEHVLANTPDGGLMRANSPLSNALSATERNSVWQRIGLMQFVRHYLNAAGELGLTVIEQAAITDLDDTEIDRWRTSGPTQLTAGTLDRLKQVVALHKALSGIEPNQEAQRRWLRSVSETIGATPISLLLDGEVNRVLEGLSGAAQLVLSPRDLPRMGR